MPLAFRRRTTAVGLIILYHKHKKSQLCTLCHTAERFYYLSKETGFVSLVANALGPGSDIEKYILAAFVLHTAGSVSQLLQDEIASFRV